MPSTKADKDKHPVVGFRIPPELVKEFTVTAELRGYTRQEAIMEAMEKFIQDPEIKPIYLTDDELADLKMCELETEDMDLIKDVNKDFEEWVLEQRY
jgi:predicted DNA-binding protein